MKAFARYVGIDYSGAQTPGDSLPGLRIFEAEGDAPPSEVPPPPSPRKYWARREIAEWLVDQLGRPEPLLVGIDHGFSFPLRYVEVHGLKPDWPSFLDDFQRHWPTDENIYVESVLEGHEGNGAARSGDRGWRRITEKRAAARNLFFNFHVQGSVAKSTHAGIPWLRFIRQRLGKRVHFWPFDGWEVPAAAPPSLKSIPGCGPRALRVRIEPRISMTPTASRGGFQAPTMTGRWRAFSGPLTPSDRATAKIEGWMLGVAG